MKQLDRIWVAVWGLIILANLHQGFEKTIDLIASVIGLGLVVWLTNKENNDERKRRNERLAEAFRKYKEAIEPLEQYGKRSKEFRDREDQKRDDQTSRISDQIRNADH